MRGPPVVLTNTLGRPVTNIISERGAVPMVVVNTLGEPVTLVSSGGEPVTLFNANGTLWDYPFSLFANNEQGAWYDPSDFSTLYQTSTGTTPVTAVEQPVGLMLDRSRGLVLGAQLAPAVASISGTVDNSGGSSGTFSAGVWSATCGSDVGYPRLRLTVPGIVVGRSYQVTFSVTLSGTITQLRARLATGGAANDIGTLSGSGTVTGIAVAANTDFIEFPPITTALASFTVTFTALSVRELPGNHASQATSASRPVLRARYNLLTYSEQFDNAGWLVVGASQPTANNFTAPDGTTTGDNFTCSSGSSQHYLRQVVVWRAAVYTLSCYFRYGTARYVQLGTWDGLEAKFCTFDLLTGSLGTAVRCTATITSAGGGWYRCTITPTTQNAASGYATIASFTDSANPSDMHNTWAAAGTETVGLWGAQLLTSADQTSTGGAYQRIAAATDYDTSNPVFRPYLAFDGTDDSFGTSSIDFSATDEMTVFAGVTKLSDAARGAIAELTASAAANNGAFLLAAPNAASATFAFESKGTALTDAVETSIAAPTTAVLTGIGDISGDVTTLRRNGTQRDSDTGDQGSGNYANAALFIGRRNNTSLPFNGRLYSLAVLGRTATAAEISAMEAWVNGKTGAY